MVTHWSDRVNNEVICHLFSLSTKPSTTKNQGRQITQSIKKLIGIKIQLTLVKNADKGEMRDSDTF